MGTQSEDLGAVARRLGAVIAQVKEAFGAPGDWGYSDPKGPALLALYAANLDLEHALVTAQANGSIDILTAAIEGAASPAMQERLAAFGAAHNDDRAEVCVRAMIAAHDVALRFTPTDRAEGLRLISMELLRAAAIVAAALKKEQGEPFSPARFAMVALNIAECVRDQDIDPIGAMQFAGRLGDALQNPDSPQSKAFLAALDEEPAQ